MFRSHLLLVFWIKQGIGPLFKNNSHKVEMYKEKSRIYFDASTLR